MIQNTKKNILVAFSTHPITPMIYPNFYEKLNLNYHFIEFFFYYTVKRKFYFVNKLFFNLFFTIEKNYNKIKKAAKEFLT